MAEESQGGIKRSWADVLGSSLPTSWNKNILEVILEKDVRGPFSVTEDECAKVLKKIGLDLVSGGQVDAVQICPSGRGVILVTLKNHVQLDKFTSYDVIEVNQSGVRVLSVKPAGEREVIVTIKGLHPNTKDEGVFTYLAKFGKLVSKKVMHGTYVEGPLKGLKNGDRSYRMETKPNDNIPTYHVLFGQKIVMRYPGQKQTCARCYNSAQYCLGGGVAKRCEAAGGHRKEFSDFILGMWARIGYSPEEVEIASAYDDHEDIETHNTTLIPEAVGGPFTPPKVQSNPTRFGGILVKTFPKETKSEEIMNYLTMCGLSQNLDENINKWICFDKKS